MWTCCMVVVRVRDVVTYRGSRTEVGWGGQNMWRRFCHCERCTGKQTQWASRGLTAVILVWREERARGVGRKVRFWNL